MSKADKPKRTPIAKGNKDVYAEAEARMGRPPIPYDPVRGARILAGLAEGIPLARLCQPEDMPSRGTFYKWMAENAEFSDAVADARRLGAESLVDDAQHIADTDADSARARNRIETRKWLAGMIAPKKYGPHLDINAHVKHELPTAEELLAARNKLEGEV